MGDLLKIGLVIFLFFMGPIGWFILYLIFVAGKK